MKYIKNLWIKFVELCFPGSYKEYLESKKIHETEIKKYRKNPQFIVGIILYIIPFMLLLSAASDWKTRLFLLSIAIGDMLIRDSVSEHYCALINRKNKNDNK